MERGEFVAEGKIEIGPSAQFFHLPRRGLPGQRLIDHFQLPSERGYMDLGRARIVVELLEEG